MSKLDSFIRRMSAQRDCLNFAARKIAELPGPVLELGLGNGRTYNHLRELFPNRDVYVFDRRNAAHKDCTPPDDRMFLGEVTDTLSLAGERFGKTAAFVHIDLGISDDKGYAALLSIVGPLLTHLVVSDGIIVSNFALFIDGWVKLVEPPGVKPGRYFLYQAN